MYFNIKMFYICKKITTNKNNMKTITVEQMEKELLNRNFFVGGLTDEAINFYYNKLIL